MAYKVVMKDGSVVEVATATRAETNGAGVFLYDDDGKQVSSFRDGTFNACYPSDSVVTPPPAPASTQESTSAS